MSSIITELTRCKLVYHIAKYLIRGYNRHNQETKQEGDKPLAGVHKYRSTALGDGSRCTFVYIVLYNNELLTSPRQPIDMPPLPMILNCYVMKAHNEKVQLIIKVSKAQNRKRKSEKKAVKLSI